MNRAVTPFCNSNWKSLSAVFLKNSLIPKGYYVSIEIQQYNGQKNQNKAGVNTDAPDGQAVSASGTYRHIHVKNRVINHERRMDWIWQQQT